MIVLMLIFLRRLNRIFSLTVLGTKKIYVEDAGIFVHFPRRGGVRRRQDGSNDFLGFDVSSRDHHSHLVITALPLPRMLGYQFAQVLPSLVIAQRLYQDPSRADEI